MSDWLELQVAHELRPTTAPEELWGRVQTARRPMPKCAASEVRSGISLVRRGTASLLSRLGKGPRSERGSVPREYAAELPKRSAKRKMSLRMPALVAIAAVLVAWVLPWSGRRSVALEDLAARELAQSGRLQLRSGDAVEIGAWLRREAGVEVAIPASSRVRLEGARVIRQGGASIGEVAYRVGDNSALLLVTRARADLRAPAKHGGLSWQKQHQIYAIACSMPERPQTACVLCHASL